MNLRQLHKLSMFKACCAFLLLALAFCYIAPAYAISGVPPPVTPPPVTPPTSSASIVPDAKQMLINLSTQIPSLMRMVTAFAYVTGFYFIFIGLLKLKQYGESRTMMSQERELKAPVIFLTVGTLLVYLPTTIQVGLSTFWVTPNPYAYLQEQNQWTELFNICFIVIQLIGTIAFIRGLIMLTHLSGHGQQDTFRKATTHIIGGILCINIYQFVQVIMVTLGIQT